MALTLRTWLESVSSLVEGAGLTRAPGIFTASATPKRMIDASFVLDVQSRNTGRYSGAGELIRMGHTLTVRFARTLSPTAQFDSQLAAMDTAEQVIAKLTRRSSLPDCVVEWSSTRPTLTPSREHVVVDVVFDVEHDWTYSTL